VSVSDASPPGASARASLLLLVLGAGPALLGGCDKPPLQDLERARRAMVRAAEAGGVLRAPDVCAAAQAALTQAEAEIRLQIRRSSWSRDFDQAKTLTRTALDASQSCVAHARAARDLRRRRAEEALASLQAAIARTQGLGRHIPDDSGIKSQVLKAEISLGEGRSSFQSGQFERAEEAAARGEAQVRGAVQAMDQFIDAFRSSPRVATWKRWAAEAVREAKRGGQAVILVDKLRRQLLVLRGDEETSYVVDLGAGGIESKTRAGDDSTPEGHYKITEVRNPGQTRYYRALMLNYPNDDDRARFRALQKAGLLPRDGRIGGNIEIHGEGGRDQDWTMGCVALSNGDMDDLVGRVTKGTSVTIVGMIPDGVLE
jgi:lipoprotein-anchoring transpeptidase ErfK/SrfK